MKRIVLTGGGTAGHVTPNIALLPKLRELGYDIHYIGSYEGIEKKLIEDVNVPYYGIASGKLRRYFDPKNFSDPFRVLKGYGEARKILKKLKPDVVFSKGGFVAVPVVLAAKHLHIPVIIHEHRDLQTRFLFLLQQKYAATSLKPWVTFRKEKQS